ncbi:MAG: pilus assembly protein N-terminal domain-containing protein [Hyphomicrobium sp.]
MSLMKWSSAAKYHRMAVAAMCCAGVMAAADAANAADLIVRYDQSQLIRLPRPVTEVIIGNPSIADVTVQGGNLLVVTGKTFGVTNVIALDAQRNVIQDQRVVVEQDPRHTVVLYKGSLRQSLTCSPTCTPAIVIGDDPAYFDVIAKSAQTKTGASAPDRGTVNQE